MELKTDKKEFLTTLKKAVLAHDEKAQVILFGSRARGDNREDSDWDILVITDSPSGRELQDKIRNDIYQIELKYSEPVSTLIFHRNKWADMQITPLYKNVVREGQPL